MTQKRFTMKGSTILENNEEITAWDCCDLLNELHEENITLKQENQELKCLLELDKLHKEVEDGKLDKFTSVEF